MSQENNNDKNAGAMDEEEIKLQIFGALVIGPSGSGKSTLCDGFDQFFTALKRKHAIINQDPANDNIKYNCAVNINEQVNLDEVQREQNLGPNGGLMYCIDFLAENQDWLKNKILEHRDCYLIFDLPGQLELFLNSDSLKKILKEIIDMEDAKLNLVVCELFDSHYCYDDDKFLSACVYSTISMVNLELPHVNVLSKVDLLKQYGYLERDIQFYLECNDQTLMKESYKKSNTRFHKKYGKLSEKLCNLVENYGYCHFYPLDVMDQVSQSNLVMKLDKSNGYQFLLAGVKEEDKTEQEKNQEQREMLYQHEALSKNANLLSEFQLTQETTQDYLQNEELKLWEKMSKGEITEDEVYALMDNLRKN